MKLLYIVLSLFFTGFSVNAQFINLEFESFDSEKGLSQNHVYAIVQDKKGFIWLGTDDGLNRFDGHDFKVYKAEEGNPNTIIDNSIRALMTDDSSVWIGTNDGLCRYFTETESVQHFSIDLADPAKLHGSQVSVIKKHKDGSKWLGYLGDGLDILIPGKKEIPHYTIRKNDRYHLKNDLISSILFMPDGDAIIGTFGGIEVLDRNRNVLSENETKKKYPWIEAISKSVRCLTLSSDQNTLWIGTELGGLFRINLKTGAVQNFNSANTRKDFEYVLAVQEDNKGNVWIGAEVIYIFDKQQDKPVPYFEYGIQGKIEIVNPIYSIFEDKDKNIWIGTFTIGVLKCNSSTSGIQHFFSNQGQESIRNEIFCFIQGDDGKIWVGTGETGLFALRKDFKGFEQAPLSGRFKTRSIKCLYKDQQGYFWIGSWNSGLIKYHPVRQTIEHYHPDKGNFGSRHAWDIAGDSIGNLWIGTLRDGLCYFYPKSGKYQYYKNVPGDTTSLINDDIMCLTIDKQKRLWVGTGYGLSVLLPGAQKFLNFQKTNNKNSLSDNLVFCLYQDTEDRMWVGTNGGGITIFNKDLTIEKIIGEKNGLPSNAIASMVADNQNNIWVSTYNGLAKINYKDLSVIEVPQLAGLRGKEFIPRSSFRSADGNLFFGRYNGFNLLHPDSLSLNPLHENVVFTSLKIQNQEITPTTSYDGRNILTRSITETDEIQLSYKDQSVTISFAPLTYNWQRSLYYAYMLEDLHSEWQYTTADRRFVHYTNLTPGDYVLKVKASFDGKNWPEEATSLRISVAPPWWETVWFKASTFLLFLFTLYTAYKIRVRYLRRSKIRLERLVKEGTREIQNLLREVAEKNQELQSINEELKAQRDALEERSQQLEQAQTKLQGINVSLEELVSKRTKKLNQTLRELETFLYRASHDLRGPISSMLGLIKVASMESGHVPINKTYTDFLEVTTIKLERTLQKLTQKYTIQKTKLSSETITKSLLISILEDATKDIPAFRPNDFELQVDDSTSFETDRMMLNIMLINLLENAFFFSERSANKKVVLQVNQSDNKTNIIITDHGPGIRHDVKDKIFTMFYRGHELSTGNGLGLYLVKSALQRVHGKISVETEVGSYSSFIVTLPDLPENGET